MHLSKEIETHLTNLNSNIRLGSTIDGIFPNKYAFVQNGKRQFRVENTSTEKEFSIVLYERSDEMKYENCFARGVFSDIKKIAIIIQHWVDKQNGISEIKKDFDELELYADFEYKNPNYEINKAWTKVKNMFFNDTTFWKTAEWNMRYLEMLNQAKSHSAFQDYFPFTSHYWLRFSVDKDIKETWPFNLHIIPTFEISNGKFYVSYDEKPMGGKYFETAIEGLNFYAEKMVEIKPIKW